ncbi:MAG: hypothetical protein U1E76_14245 [Planctomycetota bacterium]
MDTMEVIGELLIKDATSVHSPIIPRVTDAGTFAYNLLQLGGTTTGSVAAAVEHRNADESSWTNAGSFLTATSTGPKLKAISGGLKELTRFKFTLNSGSSDAWARVAIMPPVWTSAAVLGSMSGTLRLTPGLAPSIYLGSGFQGPVQQTVRDPPDPQIAVGNRFVLVVVNEQLSVYSSHDLKLRMARPLGGVRGIFPISHVSEVRCFFDNYASAQRFVISALQNVMGSTIVWLAVSITSDPTAGWYVYRYDPHKGLDFAGAGYDEHLYTVGALTSLFVWKKSRVLVGKGAPPPTELSLPPADGSYPQPVQSFGATGYHYVLQKTRHVIDHLAVWAINDSTLALSGPVFVAIVAKDPPGELPTCLNNTIQGADGRMEQATYRNGILYGSFGSEVGLPPFKRAAQWVEVDPNGWPTGLQRPTLRSTGVVAYRHHVGLSALAVNAAGQAGMVVETSDIKMPPGIAVHGRDAFGNTTGVVSVKTGVCKSGTNRRWGDYFGIAVDEEDGSFWAIGEYWLSPAAGDKWATWVQNFQVIP